MRRMFAVVSILAFCAACGPRPLSADAATDVLKNNGLLAGVEPIITQAVSQGEGSNEAIAKVALGKTVYNLKFRRYGDEWKWEFAETKNGGWIAAEQVISDIREAQRQERVMAWANAQRAPYQETIESLNGFSNNLPRLPEMSLDISSWMKIREVMKNGIAMSDRTEQERVKVTIQALGREKDAWGRDLFLNFDESSRTALFLSAGLDGKRNTPDDVIVVATGRREWDSSYDKAMFNYKKSWQVPEGFEELAAPFVDKPFGELKGSKVIQ